MRVELIRKFANAINGIDLTHVRVGDVVDMSARDAALLVAEGWAREITPGRSTSTGKQPPTSKSVA